MMEDKQFYNWQHFVEVSREAGKSSHGRLIIASCRSGSYLAANVVEKYRQLTDDAGGGEQPDYLEDIDFQFSDSETGVRLPDDISGGDIYLIQALYNPVTGRLVDQNYMAFLMAVRAFREWGGTRVTGILPYLAYARQDKPTRFQREPTSIKLLADLAGEAGLQRLLVWHPHVRQIQGFYGSIPVDIMESVLLFTDRFRGFSGKEDVIAVAPDAGAMKFVSTFSRILQIPSAAAIKHRPRAEEASIAEVIGNFGGKRTAIVLDDMIASGKTMYKLIKRIVEKHGIEEVYLGVSHNLCTAEAKDRISELHAQYGLKQLIVTNSIPQPRDFASRPYVTVIDLSEAIARVVNRIHYNQSITELFYYPG